MGGRRCVRGHLARCAEPGGVHEARGVVLKTQEIQRELLLECVNKLVNGCKNVATVVLTHDGRDYYACGACAPKLVRAGWERQK